MCWYRVYGHPLTPVGRFSLLPFPREGCLPLQVHSTAGKMSSFQPFFPLCVMITKCLCNLARWSASAETRVYGEMWSITVVKVFIEEEGYGEREREKWTWGAHRSVFKTFWLVCFLLSVFPQDCWSSWVFVISTYFWGSGREPKVWIRVKKEQVKDIGAFKPGVSVENHFKVLKE